MRIELKTRSIEIELLFSYNLFLFSKCKYSKLVVRLWRIKLRAIISLLVLFLLAACSEDHNTNPIPEVVYTQIYGKQSGELKSANSPYRVTQDILVDSNSTLIIRAGVEIFFNENTRLIVKGELLVEGNNLQYVRFISYDKTKKWNGIKILNADKPAKINFAKIQDIRQEFDTSFISSSISIMNSEVEFNHTFFDQNSAIHGGAVGAYNAKLIFTNNIVRNNEADVWGGAIMSELSEITVINNTFYQNYSGNNCGGIFVYDPVKTELQNNIFYKNASRIGNINFQYASTDSTDLIEQYNYLAFGSMDPKFLSESILKLDQTSPCINSGNPDPFFNDYDGSRNDQGAYGGPVGDW